MTLPQPAQDSALVRIIRSLSWAALAASLLGVALHTDATASDALAPKAFWFALAATLLPALAVLKLWMGAPLRLPKGTLAVAWGMVLLAHGLAYWLSPLQAHAQGAWQAWLLMALFFMGAYDLLEGETAWLSLLRVLSAVALLAGLWSVAQALGLDHTAMGKACQAAFGPRIAGTLGNPNFAGGFFVLLLPVLAWSAWREPKRWARILAGAATLAATLGLVLSASKAALLGLGLELAVAGHLFFWSAADLGLKRKVLQRVGLGFAIAVLAGLAILPSASRQRLFQGWKPGSESIEFRLQTWGGALQAIHARPVVGWGPGNFSVVYPTHRLPQATAGLAQRSYEVSHAENWVIQTLVESGVLGLGALGFLLFCLLLPLRLKAVAWDSEDLAPSLALALTVALLGSLACNLASLDAYLPSTLLPLLALAALAARVAPAPVFTLSLSPEGYAKVLVSFGLAIFASVPIIHAQMQWRASRDLAEAKAYSAAGRFDEAIPLYQRVNYLNPAELEARYFLASSLQDRAKGTDLQEAEKEYAQLRLQAPDYVLVHAKLARLYTAQGRKDEAAVSWQQQLKLDPYLLQGTQELASLYASQGKLSEAREVLSAGLLRHPGRVDLTQNLATVDAAMAKNRR